MPDKDKPYQRFLKMWAAGTGRPNPPSNVINLAAKRRARQEEACDYRARQVEVKSA